MRRERKKRQAQACRQQEAEGPDVIGSVGVMRSDSPRGPGSMSVAGAVSDDAGPDRSATQEGLNILLTHTPGSVKAMWEEESEREEIEMGVDSGATETGESRDARKCQHQRRRSKETWHRV